MQSSGTYNDHTDTDPEVVRPEDVDFQAKPVLPFLPKTKKAAPLLLSGKPFC